MRQSESTEKEILLSKDVAMFEADRESCYLDKLH
jgi:hypothetical protein